MSDFWKYKLAIAVPPFKSNFHACKHISTQKQRRVLESEREREGVGWWINGWMGIWEQGFLLLHRGDRMMHRHTGDVNKSRAAAAPYGDRDRRTRRRLLFREL